MKPPGNGIIDQVDIIKLFHEIQETIFIDYIYRIQF